MSVLGMLLCSVAIIAVKEASALKYKDCGSSSGKVTSVHVSGCEDHDVCPIKRGSTVTIAVSFESLTDSETLQAVAHGIVGGVPIPFPPPQRDACIESGITCPIEKGQNYDYVTEIEIKENYPKLQADVKWELKDDNETNVFCIRVPAQII